MPGLASGGASPPASVSCGPAAPGWERKGGLSLSWLRRQRTHPRGRGCHIGHMLPLTCSLPARQSRTDTYRRGLCLAPTPVVRQNGVVRNATRLVIVDSRLKPQSCYCLCPCGPAAPGWERKGGLSLSWLRRKRTHPRGRGCHIDHIPPLICSLSAWQSRTDTYRRGLCLAPTPVVLLARAGLVDGSGDSGLRASRCVDNAACGVVHGGGPAGNFAKGEPKATGKRAKGEKSKKGETGV